LDELDNFKSQLDRKETTLKERAFAVDNLAREKAKGFATLAKVYDDYVGVVDGDLARRLEIKSHPAIKTAEAVRQISKERCEAEKAARFKILGPPTCVGFS
jgi:hypothetical protein